MDNDRVIAADLDEELANFEDWRARRDCCEDWKPQCEKVNAPIMLAFARNPQNPQYDGKPFRFCPWCGAKR